MLEGRVHAGVGNRRPIAEEGTTHGVEFLGEAELDVVLSEKRRLPENGGRALRDLAAVDDRHRDLGPVTVQCHLGHGADLHIGRLHRVAGHEMLGIVECRGETQGPFRGARRLEGARRGEDQQRQGGNGSDARAAARHGQVCCVGTQGTRPRPSMSNSG